MKRILYLISLFGMLHAGCRKEEKTDLGNLEIQFGAPNNVFLGASLYTEAGAPIGRPHWQTRDITGTPPLYIEGIKEGRYLLRIIFGVQYAPLEEWVEVRAGKTNRYRF